MKALQPKTIINNRLDLGQGNNDRQILSANADYYTPEQHVGGYDDQRPWESCMTTSRRGQWAWGGQEDGVKSLEACMNMLIRCAGGDGNLLLNVGPMPTGEIAPEQAEPAEGNGRVAGEIRREHLRHARRPVQAGRLRRLDAQRQHHLPPRPGLARRHADAAGHSGEGRAQSRARAAARPKCARRRPVLKSPCPKATASRWTPSWRWNWTARALDLAAMDVPGAVSLTTKAKATASNIFQNQAEFGPDKAVDGRSDTRWATDAGTKSAWLEVDLGQPKTFSRAVIKQAFPELKRVRKFAIEYWQDGQWKTVLPRREPRRDASPPVSSRSLPSACD